MTGCELKEQILLKIFEINNKKNLEAKGSNAQASCMVLVHTSFLDTFVMKISLKTYLETANSFRTY